MTRSAGECAPRATLRLQLHAGFGFGDALRQVDYFQRLGVSHLYLSPIGTARRGSLHGYDVVDPTRINPELGGEDAFRALCAALRARGMGVILDIVPNHMAVGGGDNPWWLDVLEWGIDSAHANTFDIDWDVDDPLLARKVLCPFLGKPYGEALAAGEIELRFDAARGRFAFAYFEHRFPLAPQSYAELMGRLGDADLARVFAGATHGARALRRARFDAACAQLATRADALRAPVRDLLAGFVREPRALHPLLERQHHRLAWWRCAADEINWRRFFDVIHLAGLRMQEPEVFEAVHALPLRLYREGLIDGLRIDHVDGLADPRRYCRTLRSRLAALERERPPDAAHGPAYLVVEKILAPGERLPLEWETDGTTGYVFMNEVGGVLCDPAGEQPLSRLWARMSGRAPRFEVEERSARRSIALSLFAADFHACAHALHAIAGSEPATRDWTRRAIERVLATLISCFPVYRTYVDLRGRSHDDEQIMARVVEAAMPLVAPSERELLHLVDRWLGGEPPLRQRGMARQRRLRAVARFQQLTAPVAAKAVEDTAFYRHGRLLARNEVGGDPSQFALTVDEFHRACRDRRRRYPRAMLATATHDHKRGEDLRARLAVLSEVAEPWATEVESWRKINASLKTGEAPDGGDETMLYQMLAGAWPPALEPADASGVAAFAQRIGAWQRKAVREAKRHSGWVEPNESYEQACQDFIAAILDPQRGAAFLPRLHAFVQRIAPAGAVNALAQALLRMTTPGVPDLYQGAELWDFSLVDPDNRGEVDFVGRARTLDDGAPLDELLRSWSDGRIKQRVIARTLALRREVPELFARGDYLPLRAYGARAAQCIAFARVDGDESLLVVVPRCCARRVESDTLRVADWGTSWLRLPPALRGPVRDASSGATLELGERVPLADLLGGAPFALLRPRR